MDKNKTFIIHRNTIQSNMEKKTHNHQHKRTAGNKFRA